MEFIAGYSFFSIWLAVFIPLVTVGILLVLIYKEKRIALVRVAAIILFVLAFLALVALGVIIYQLYISAQGG